MMPPLMEESEAELKEPLDEGENMYMCILSHV